MIKAVSETEFNTVIETNNLVVVDFFAVWCGPCKMMTKVLEQLSTKFDQVTFIKVDVDQENDLSHKYQVRAMPTVVFIQNAKEVNRIVGFRPEAEITELLLSLLN